MAKKDVDAQKTKKLFQKAFKELMKSKPYDAITAVEIARLAGYNRSTFYQYFEDKHQVLLSFYEESIAKLTGGVFTYDDWMNPEPPKSLVEAFEFARVDPKVPKLLILHKQANEIQRGLHARIEMQFRGSISKFYNYDPIDNFVDYIAEYVASGQVALLKHCCQYNRWANENYSQNLATLCHRSRRAIFSDMMPSSQSTEL